MSEKQSKPRLFTFVGVMRRDPKWRLQSPSSGKVHSAIACLLLNSSSSSCYDPTWPKFNTSSSRSKHGQQQQQQKRTSSSKVTIKIQNDDGLLLLGFFLKVCDMLLMFRRSNIFRGLLSFSPFEEKEELRFFVWIVNKCLSLIPMAVPWLCFYQAIFYTRVVAFCTQLHICHSILENQFYT